MTIIIDGDLSRPVLAKAEGLLPHAFAAASHMPPLSSRRELGKKSAGRGTTGEPHLLSSSNPFSQKWSDFGHDQILDPKKGDTSRDPKTRMRSFEKINTAFVSIDADSLLF